MDYDLPTGFDDDGQPILVAMPAVYDDHDQEQTAFDPQAFLDALVSATRTPGEIGERVLCLSYLLNRTAPESVPTGPKTLRQLADSIGVSHVAAARRVNRLRADFIEQFASCLNNRPHSCE